MYIVGHKHPAAVVPCQLYGGVLPIVSYRSGVSKWDSGSFVLPVYINSLFSPWAGKSISIFFIIVIVNLNPWCFYQARSTKTTRSWYFSQAFFSLCACLFAGGNEIVIIYMWSTDLWGSSSVSLVFWVKGSGFDQNSMGHFSHVSRGTPDSWQYEWAHPQVHFLFIFKGKMKVNKRGKRGKLNTYNLDCFLPTAKSMRHLYKAGRWWRCRGDSPASESPPICAVVPCLRAPVCHPPWSPHTMRELMSCSLLTLSCLRGKSCTNSLCNNHLSI